MNNWQYARWIYLSGRTIKNKSLSLKQRNSYIVFIQKMLTSRSYLSNKLNIKKGNYRQISKQSDNSLGKMVQVIGTSIKTLPLSVEQINYCDQFFKSTDKRRFQTYKDYQVNSVQITINNTQSLNNIINDLKNGDTIILQGNEYNLNLNIQKNDITIKGDENVVLNGQIVVTGNNLNIENINVEKIVIEEQVNGLCLTNVNTQINVNKEINTMSVSESELQSISFNEKSENVQILNSTIKGQILFNKQAKDIAIIKNEINSQNGIVFNEQAKGNILIQGNKFNK